MAARPLLHTIGVSNAASQVGTVITRVNVRGLSDVRPAGRGQVLWLVTARAACDIVPVARWAGSGRETYTLPEKEATVPKVIYLIVTVWRSDSPY